jgi:hypothetical protein
MVEQLCIQSVIADYARDGDLSDEKKEFLASTYNRFVEEGDFTKALGTPHVWIQEATDSVEYGNCTWAHCLCNVLVALGIDTEYDPLEAPYELFDAESSFVDEEEEAEQRRQKETWDALTEDERMEALEDCVRALESP